MLIIKDKCDRTRRNNKKKKILQLKFLFFSKKRREKRKKNFSMEKSVKKIQLFFPFFIIVNARLTRARASFFFDLPLYYCPFFTFYSILKKSSGPIFFIKLFFEKKTLEN